MTGKQIIKVDHVTVKEFETNPNMIWNYDVMMHGIWNVNHLNVINDNAIEVVRKYIDAGKGVLISQEALGYQYGNSRGMGKLKDKFNIVVGKWGNNQYDVPRAWIYGGTKIKQNKSGVITQFPWNTGNIGEKLNIRHTHTTSNAAKGDVWFELTDGDYYKQAYSTVVPEAEFIKSEEEKNNVLSREANARYYLTTWNNTAMTQAGHEGDTTTEVERKIIANTLIYLTQSFKRNQMVDDSAKDIAEPNKPVNISTAVNEDNTTNIKFNRPEDKGSTYEYYVEETNENLQKTNSNTQKVEVKTGVKKYKYQVVEGSADPVEGEWREVETTGDNENLPIGQINYTGTPKYIHIKAVDGAGNESEVYTQKLEKPANQEIEIIKEVVNPKNEYKVGDKLTYKVKFKIKENDTNKGKISNIELIDTYNSSYLKLVNNSIVKQNGIEVNTSTIGKIQTNIPTLNYGETKELQYDMEILDSANRKRRCNK
mgnify:CR=1 FL=1